MREHPDELAHEGLDAAAGERRLGETLGGLGSLGYLGYLGSALGVTTRPAALAASGAAGTGQVAASTGPGVDQADARAGRRRLLTGVGLFVAGFTAVLKPAT